MDTQDAKEIRFDGWTLHARSGELLRDGACTRLQERPLRILELLLAHPGELVTREQLIAHLWPEGVVDFDTGINTAIRKLRIALGDDAETPKYIETIPRRGYRFIGKIEHKTLHSEGATREAAAPEAPPNDVPSVFVALNRPWIAVLLFLFVVGLSAIGVVKYRQNGSSSRETAASIVVLPFIDMSAARLDQPLCDGLTEELSNWLSQLPGLRVVSRTSAFYYKDRHPDVRQVGKDLNVSHVLEGSVQHVGDQIRVTAQLIDATNGYHLWSKSFDIPVTNILQVEDSVSRSVAEAMQVRLLPDISQRWAARRPEGAAALESYLKARHYYLRRTAKDNKLARDYYNEAIRIDKQFVLAYIGLAETEINEIAISHRSIDEVVRNAEPPLKEATLLSPGLPDLYAVRGWLLSERNRLDEAEALLVKAIALNPNDADSPKYLGGVYRHKGLLRAEAEQYRKAIKLGPLDFVPHIRLCLTLQGLGEFFEATQACAQARKIEPDNYWTALTEAWLDKNQGRLDQAYEKLRGALDPKAPVSALVSEMANIQLILGLNEEARRTYESYPSTDWITQRLRIAQVYAAERDIGRIQPLIADIAMSPEAALGDLVNLMRLQMSIGDQTAAFKTLHDIKRREDYVSGNLFDPDAVRNDYSAAFYCGAVDFLVGDRTQGAQQLTELAAMLDGMEKNGAVWSGIYSLRARLLAVQGNGDAAMIALKHAATLGWAWSREAQREPYLNSLATRADYRALIGDIENANANMKTHVQALHAK